MVIDHHPERASRFQNAPRLAHALGRIRAVVHHSIRAHDVESIIGKRQVLGVALAQIGRVTCNFTALLAPAPRTRLKGRLPSPSPRTSAIPNSPLPFARRFPARAFPPRLRIRQNRECRVPIHNAPAHARRSPPARPNNASRRARRSSLFRHGSETQTNIVARFGNAMNR